MSDIADQLARDLKSAIGGAIENPNGQGRGLPLMVLPPVTPHLYDRYRATLAKYEATKENK